jgi:hypothetical protein
MMDGTRKTLSSTSSRQNNCARDSHSKSRELLACLWRLDLTFSSILSLSLSLSLSLCVHVLEACIWVSLHSLLVHKSLSGEFVYEVELLAVEVSLNSLHVGKSFSQKLVCEVEVAFEVSLHWPMC